MKTSKRHIAGIIPVAGREDKFGFEWPDCMMPLSEDYTCIERSVLECAWAGCKTIWIVCNDDVSPAIKYRVGEYVYDPVWHFRKDKYPNESRRVIPIFYVPLHPKDINKRDCLSWSIIYGALTAFKVGSSLSVWSEPYRYYVSFPLGVYDPSVIRPHRAAIKKEENFAVSYKGLTVKEDQYMGFTFGKEDWLEFRRVIRTGTGRFSSEGVEDSKYPRKLLPLHERYSAKNFPLSHVLSSIEFTNKADLATYNPIETWQGYREYMSSNNILKKPKSYLTNGSKLNKICIHD